MNVTANFDIESQDKKAYLDSFGETPEGINNSIEEKTEIDAEIDLLSESDTAPVLVEPRATVELVEEKSPHRET